MQFANYPARLLGRGLMFALLAATLAASSYTEVNASSAIINPDFKAYDMTGLSWLPPQLVDKGYEAVPVLYMCHMWNSRFGVEPTNCNGVDFSRVDHEVVRQRAREMKGIPIVVIDIERVNNPTSEVWHILSEDAEVTQKSVELWRELIAVFREENTESEIMIYKPIRRIWWTLIKDRRMPLLNYAEKTLAARYRESEIIAPLFSDKGLMAWASAYVYRRDETEVYREDRKWQISICKELYKTRCIFALHPFYVDMLDEQGQRVPVDEEWFYQMLRELEEDGADGFGIWLGASFRNDRYVDLVKAWADGDKPADPTVQWLSAIDRFLSERHSTSQP